MKTIVIGIQWGDEGKGKIVDVLAENHDVIVRYNGGANAGHTVYRGEKKYIFHMVPSGILYPDKICVIGNGCVVDLDLLRKEMTSLEADGIDFAGRFYISDRAKVIMPYHKEKESGEKRLDTTKKGIGPAYTSRASRTALTVGDIFYTVEDTSLEKEVLSRLCDDMELHGMNGE
ncbi:MAG: adenylosuccinate synthetase, partial [Candidatus Aenigmarchaeota archaeon]|nr:adenylosuccinate synthetase [Candidatus Aenigmarchaeota archaeon]MDI6722745.1 adenylosuccinate synthetase [Candidatus Aenigmarchaeota archaeon]